MATGTESETDAESGVRSVLRQVVSFERDVLVLSLAMFAFSLAFQMTSRYVPEYLRLFGAGPVVIGLFGTLGNVVSFAYPYPGGALSDRLGSRRALTLFGLLSTLGFVVWLFADLFGVVTTAPVTLGPYTLGSAALGPYALPELTLPVGIFLGLLLAQCWKSFGLGATFAVVKQATTPERLATGFASTETVRRFAFLLGPLFAAAVLAAYSFEDGFRVVLAVAATVSLVGTVAQHVLYDASEDTLGKSFAGVGGVVTDLRSLPSELPPLLVGDTLVRFGNGMVYTFVVVVVVEFLEVGVTLPVVGRLGPAAFFGVLLAVEMAVALLTMAPVAALSRRVGLKPVVALGFAVYAVFPVLLVSVPTAVPASAEAAVVTLLFAFSGLRFAGLPAHKALVVGPAETDAGGRVTGSYYLVRNLLVVPSAALGGVLYAVSPELSFTVASAVGLLGVVLFLVFGEEFEDAIAA
ncbi:MFS transporter [Halomarina oriensis]|uniref:MFS transporter n=1 Tax=Halomarina oriensis TaxID=671145 RepID=A0A6B0GEF7_9EURY|nr:MFS transporter [Halomarina oriensis]MWG32910.1 MFS transporter [Halomarina oriensis]